MRSISAALLCIALVICTAVIGPVWAITTGNESTFLQKLPPLAPGSNEIIEFIGSVTGPWSAFGVTVAGDYAYVAAKENGLRIIDVANPAAPREIGFYNTPGTAVKVYIMGHYALVADGPSGVRIIDVGDPSRPQEIAHIDPVEGGSTDVVVSGNYAYISGWGLKIVDISNPTQPTEIGFISLGFASDLAVIGNHLIMAGGSYTKIVDIADPTAPQEVGNWPEFEVTMDVAAIGNLVYLIDAYGFLEVIDISNPAAPEEIGFLGWWDSGATGLALAGDYAYISSGELSGGGLRVISISNTTAMTMVAFYPTPTYPNDVAAVNGYLYVANNDAGLLILEHSDPTSSFIDLSIDSIEPIQVSEGQDLVHNKDMAVKVVIHKKGNKSVQDVASRLNIDSFATDRFFVYDPANLDDEYQLRWDNDTFQLNFGPGESTKIIYYFDDSLKPKGDSVTASAVVDPSNDIAEANETNNTGTMLAPRAVHVAENFKVRFFPVDFSDEEEIEDDLNLDYLNFINTGEKYILDTWPVAVSQWSGSYRETSVSTHLYHGFDGRLSVRQLRLWALSQSITQILEDRSADRYIGVVPLGWFGRSMADARLRGAIGVYPDSSLPLMLVTLNSIPTLVHELVHSYQFYLQCEQYEPGCEDIGQEQGLPADPGLNVRRKMPILPEGGFKSIMSGGSGKKWWWAQDYQQLLNERRKDDSRQVPVSQNTRKIILAAGTIRKDGTASLTDWFVLSGTVLSDLSDGPYLFEYLNSSGTILHVEDFDVQFSYYDLQLDEASFAFRIPYIDGTTEIQLRNANHVLATKTASQNPPSVHILTPTPSEVASVPVDITWSGTDVDGDSLSYTILVSIDGGARWQTIAHDLSTTSYQWEATEMLPGSRFLLKLIATDGFHATEVLADAPFYIDINGYIPVIVR